MISADPATYDEPRDVVRWAVVGSSDFALNWVVPALKGSRGAQLAAVVSRDPDRLQARWRPPNGVAVVSKLADLVDVAVDAVHIATPNDLHASQTTGACDLGLHVLVEKPMGLTSAECLQMETAASDAGVLLTVGSCMAWAPPVVASIQAVHDGRIGTPTYASISVGFDSPPAQTWRQTTPTQDGGGPLFDLGPHAVDALVRLLGPVTGVGALLSRLRHDYAAEDTATLHLLFARGANALVHLSFAAALNALSVHGTSGRLESSEWLGRRFRGDLSLHRRARSASGFNDDVPGTAGEPLTLQTTDVLSAQVEETSRAIRDGWLPRNAVRPFGLHVADILDAAVQSASSGQFVEIESSP